MDPLESKIRTQLAKLKIADKSVLQSGVIDSLEVKDTTAYIHLLLPDKLKQHTQSVQKDIASSLQGLIEIKEVKFSVSTQKEEAKAQRQTAPAVLAANPKNSSLLQNYKHIIVIASGKGGVGKSTVALNLALALKKLKFIVALFDADIYGPSIPMMMGMRNHKPETVDENLVPLNNFGIEYISMGNLVAEGDSIVWRGPMVHQAVQQLLRDTSWSGGDFMIIDLPPGTGDIQISISQITAITGAVIVCTPQDLALIDARRAMAMFEKVNIPILGMVENMSYFICPSCKQQTAIFGTGGAQQESKNLGFTFLGKIPLDLKIREGGDRGVPVMIEEHSYLTSSYQSIAGELLKTL